MTAAKAERIGRALDAPSPDIRLYLLYGPDESGSRALADRLGRAMGAAAERIDLTGPALKADPARLADEAAAIALFGGPRWVRVEPAGDEIVEAVDALLGAPAAGNPVVLVAGALRRDSKLVQRATASGAALACASYAPEGRDADQLVIALGRDAGLQIAPDVARRLVAATGSDRALIAREIEKLALYRDAAPDRPQPLDHAALDALGADSDEGDLNRLVDAVLDGALDAVAEQMARLGEQGVSELRALLRRLLLLAQLRGVVDAGETPARALEKGGRALFWRDRDTVARQLQRWTSPRLATAIRRLAAAESALKTSGSAGPLLIEAEFVAIAREAARRR